MSTKSRVPFCVSRSTLSASARSVQETCNFDVLFAYLTTRNYDFAYDKTHNVRPKRNIRMAMQHEVSMYAIAQKEGEGFGARRPLLASAGAMVAHARHACNRRQRPRQGGRGLQVPHEALRRHGMDDHRLKITTFVRSATSH